MMKVKLKCIWRVEQLNKCLVLFVEGKTEVEFYKQLIRYIRECAASGKLNHKIICRSVNGIGGFKKEVNRIFLKEILPKLGGYSVVVALCYDTDVFGYVQKPKMNWGNIEKMLLQDGAERVIHIRAEKSIEDWFLLDMEGVKRFLKLKPDVQTNGVNGYEKLKSLFKKANKIYTKGQEVNGFVEALDIGLISKKVSNGLELLYRELEAQETAEKAGE